VKKLIEAAVRAIFGVEPSEISMLFFLWYTHQSESFSNLIEIENGNQDRKLIYGSQYLSSYLSQEIEKQGGKVLLSSPVRLVRRFDDKTIDVYSGESKYSCDYLVVAMPPVSVQRIEFVPKLSR
jgi:monoamine oxidase